MAEVSEKSLLIVPLIRKGMAFSAIPNAVKAIMESVPFAGNIAPQVSVTMALFASNPSPMAAVPVIGTKESATVKTAMLVARNQAYFGIPDAELVFRALGAAFAHPIAQKARHPLASHVLRLLTLAVLATCFPADPIKK